ncbi:hypothetical protein VC35_17595 [Pseudomonas fluorescens]|uniref:Uncharacterized protein n=1 Tax=Pseudomonas fluorescens TaxID=294 RepID=A0A0F4TJT0_PSEFL|nr:hypothetical protein VC35_17595 [Pseudomonas fluorescens]
MLFLITDKGLYVRLRKQWPVLRQVISHATYLLRVGGQIPHKKKGRPVGLPLENFVLARHLWRRLTSRRLLDSV